MRCISYSSVVYLFLRLNRKLHSSVDFRCFIRVFILLGVQKKELSVIGEGCELGDKVTVKQCSIGKGCQIGAKSKLNNCVLMDYTIIGER